MDINEIERRLIAFLESKGARDLATGNNVSDVLNGWAADKSSAHETTSAPVTRLIAEHVATNYGPKRGPRREPS